MRIGKQDAPYSAICTSDADSITVRGRDLTTQIIGKMDFTSYFWLLVTGQEPNEDQAFFANAILCALAEHGLVPSVVAARMTLAAAPEAMQGAVAAGLLGCGSVVLGSAEVAGRFYAECVADKNARKGSRSEVAIEGPVTDKEIDPAVGVVVDPAGPGESNGSGVGDDRIGRVMELGEDLGKGGVGRAREQEHRGRGGMKS